MMHYLGPSVGKVPLSTWDEVVSAAQGGLIEENQWVELKEMLGPPNKAVNTELARDLASLALYGGVLVFGVRDRTLEVVGCDITAMAERISQVASTRVHPPLSPVVYPVIAHPKDENRHLLVVEVPPSAQAPHMVDSAYWGRSSDGKRRLSDPEVRDRMESRTGDAAAFRTRLLGMVEDDPLAPMIEGHPTGNSHIYLLAQPCTEVLGVIDDLNLQNVVVGLFSERQQMGTLSSLRYSVGEPQGLALVSPGADTPAERRHEDDVCYLRLVEDDSSLQYVSGGGSMFRSHGRGRDEQPVEVIGTSAIAQSTLQFFRLVEDLSLQKWGYAGQWRIGIHVSNLAGKQLSFNDLWTSRQNFSGKSFTSQVVVSPASWTEGPEPEARKLLSGFLRAIGQDGRSLDWVTAS